MYRYEKSYLKLTKSAIRLEIYAEGCQVTSMTWCSRGYEHLNFQTGLAFLPPRNIY